MTHPTVTVRLLRCLLSVLLLLPLAAAIASDDEDRYGDDREALPFSDLSFPEPEREYSEETECVQPEDEMRRNHMNYILHQRDETVHKGVRTRQYSLEECINCHAAKDDQGEYIAINAPDQFCSSCHTYASVSIDCFQCHATKPARPSTLKLLSSGMPHHTETPGGNLPGETHQLLAAEDQPQ